MATYAIGDVHGCARTLDLLLGDLPFDAASDRLWMVGDLVNRGPDSLGVLRWARGQHEGLGDRFVTVLGNHDLHLIAAHLGVARRPQPDLDPILAADDGAEQYRSTTEIDRQHRPVPQPREEHREETEPRKGREAASADPPGEGRDGTDDQGPRKLRDAGMHRPAEAEDRDGSREPAAPEQESGECAYRREEARAHRRRPCKTPGEGQDGVI
ncbi:MAG: metallophosphoesterase [Pseudomonadota bacterium]